MSFLPYSSSGVGGWFSASFGSVVTHAGVVALALGGVQQMFEMQRDDPSAALEYTVTLERLDSDTLIGLLNQQGEAGSDDGEGVDSVLPDTEDAVEPERLAALTPEEIDTPEPEPVVPETVESEEPEEAEPETLESETPEAIESETPEAITPEAVAPEAVTPEAITPEAVVPEAPALQAVEAIAPEPSSPLMDDDGPLLAETVTAQPVAAALSPLVPEGTADVAVRPRPGAAQTVQPVTSAVAAVAPVTQPRAATTPTRPAVSPAPATPARPRAAPSEQDLAIGDLLQRIRSAAHEPCLIALPRRDGEDGVGLALIGQSEAAMVRFAADVLTAEDADIRQTRTLVDERQCAALNYVRTNQDYPATRLGIRLDAAEVPTGGRLTGVLRGTAGRYLLLLLVDNNGVAQDLQRFLSSSGNFTRFDVPVTRSGAPRDTKQMLIAIAARKPVTRMKNKAGQLAQNMFAGLEGELATGAALAVTTFDVR